MPVINKKSFFNGIRIVKDRSMIIGKVTSWKLSKRKRRPIYEIGTKIDWNKMRWRII